MTSCAIMLRVADTIEFCIVYDVQGTIAETDLGPEINVDLGPAVGWLANKGPPYTPLIKSERPLKLGPDGLNCEPCFRWCTYVGQ